MSALGPDSLVLCTATMGGVPLREFLATAGGAGFTAVSLGGGDYAAARAAGLSDADIRRILADQGLSVAEMDGAVDWLGPLPRDPARAARMSPYDLSIPFFGHTGAELLAAGAAVGARSLTAVDPFFRSAPVERMAEAFAALCDRAADHGLLVHLEFLSWGPVPDLATAWEVVRLADRDNGGIAVDTLHLARSGSRDRLDSVPGDRIFATQFSDGAASRVTERWLDAADRALPGDGDLDLVEIVRALDRNGCRAPIGGEVMNAELAASPAAVTARLVHDALTRLLAAARVRD